MTKMSRPCQGTTRLMSLPPFSPGPSSRTVRTPAGKVMLVPADWVLLPPGDAGLTRRVKAAGDHWVVQEKIGRRLFSRGVWAAAATVDCIRAGLDAERSTDAYAKKQESAVRRREQVQEEYVEDFQAAIEVFLRFHDGHEVVSKRLALIVAAHAAPVGSGTVARTKRIPIERRAEAAVIAWMRHQTTAYDSMPIPRVKGKRREVRQMLAQHSHAVLQCYRRGDPIPANCPLKLALGAESTVEKH